MGRQRRLQRGVVFVAPFKLCNHRCTSRSLLATCNAHPLVSFWMWHERELKVEVEIGVEVEVEFEHEFWGRRIVNNDVVSNAALRMQQTALHTHTLTHTYRDNTHTSSPIVIINWKTFPAQRPAPAGKRIYSEESLKLYPPSTCSLPNCIRRRSHR